jgi:CheY-like chemotaxis protein
VDDNKDAADSLCLLLRLWGYDCRVAYDGAAGLALACDHQPDCLILDIAMPGMDGYGLAREVCARPALGRAKLIALSAYSDEMHLRRAREAGFNFLLTKTTAFSEIERLMDMLTRVVRFEGKAEEMDPQNITLDEDPVQEIKEGRAFEGRYAGR